MALCVCKKSIEGFGSKFDYIKNSKYEYKSSYIKMGDNIIKTYMVYQGKYLDWTYFEEYDFNNFFIPEKELRKQKLKKLGYYESW
jgi:hypothetical protein